LRDISSRNDEEKLLNTKVQLSGETRTFYVLETGRSIARWKGLYIYMVSGEGSGAGRRKIFRPATRHEIQNGSVFSSNQSWLMPPSATSSVPTINADSDVARYNTALAISSGVPNRLSGIWA